MFMKLLLVLKFMLKLHLIQNLFSSSSTKFGAEPNTQVSLVDAAFPGMLPVINEYCVKQAIKTGLV